MSQRPCSSDWLPRQGQVYIPRSYQMLNTNPLLGSALCIQYLFSLNVTPKRQRYPQSQMEAPRNCLTQAVSGLYVRQATTEAGYCREYGRVDAGGWR